MSEPQYEKVTEEINCVSAILLSYNGIKYLNEKISFLIRELSSFEFYELIIVDDHSTDGSIETLENFRTNDHIKLLFNNNHRGIPFSMNLSVATAQYEYVIFCDQRQELSQNIIRKVVDPLKFINVGAVSGCISDIDKGNNCSYMRRHENFLKLMESKSGSLIGVYGPFYAIKKHCYCQIPEVIILDDLYLSLKILKSKQIVLKEGCYITDDCFTNLYDYKRTKRYLLGLLQIVKERSIINDLSRIHLTMLIWHKYIRLLIPLSIFLSYITLGLMVNHRIEYLILFSSFTVIGLLTILLQKFNNLFNLKNLIRLNVFYVIALVDIFIKHIMFQKKDFRKHKITLPNLGSIKSE
jgi:poly-beta-1,6-N-acetyl-D-glucosamine synthase